MGRPIKLIYPDDGREVQFKVNVPPGLKRALGESAMRSERTLGEEARLAFVAWLEEESTESVSV